MPTLPSLHLEGQKGDHIAYTNILNNGYAFSGTLTLAAGCFSAKTDAEIAWITLVEFASTLQKVWDTLSGTAEFNDHYSGLSFSITMTSGGHALVRGKFRPIDDGRDNILSFEINTDQSYLDLFLNDVQNLLSSAVPTAPAPRESFFQTILRRLTEHFRC